MKQRIGMAGGGSTPEGELVERVQWLLRLRWLLVPVFVAVDLANDLLTRRQSPWVALALGGLLLAGNGCCAWLLHRKSPARVLLGWIRLEAMLVVLVPVSLVVFHGEPDSAVRYGVLVGVVGAALVLPRSADVALVGVWAVVALIGGDAMVLRFDPSRIDARLVARWAWDAGIVITVSIIVGQLHAAREWATVRARAALQGLDHAKAEWEVAFDSLNDMVFITDRAGKLVRVNRAFGRLLGARPHELVGRQLSELMAGHPERWWTLTGDGIVEIEDPEFDTLFEVDAHRIDDRLVRVARDVGEQRRLYARLVQADKLAAVGVLASGVAHEINNPTSFVSSNLTELKGYLQSLDGALIDLSEVGLRAGATERVSAIMGRPELHFARREGLATIQESQQGMERIRQIVNNLRSLARRDQTGEPAAPVELGEVVQAVVKTADFDLRNAAAHVDLQGAVWVMGHRGELVDVVLNLVVNAVQSREEGRPNRVSVELGRDGPHAVLQVSDTGKGIAPSHVKRLFEPFFTTKAPGEGTGLGLNLARKIVLAHGGSIDVTTDVGVGSTFTVRLPAVDVGERSRSSAVVDLPGA